MQDLYAPLREILLLALEQRAQRVAFTRHGVCLDEGPLLALWPDIQAWRDWCGAFNRSLGRLGSFPAKPTMIRIGSTSLEVEGQDFSRPSRDIALILPASVHARLQLQQDLTENAYVD